MNFQPVSITGRINRAERESMRITIPDLVRLAEEQTGGFIKKGDWYPVPAVQPLISFLSRMKEESFVDFCAHRHCGMGTYLFMDGDTVKPIPRIIDVDETLGAFAKANKRLVDGEEILGKLELAAGLFRSLRFRALSKYISDVVLHSDYLSLNRMHHKMILVSSMHFMDPYNFDLERARRCVIHYATPDGRIIPFCTMNTIHRESVERRFARPLNERDNTPLYDVDSLTKRIIEEDERRGGSWLTEPAAPLLTRWQE